MTAWRAGDAAAREELITHNLRLVVYLAKKVREQRRASPRTWCPSAPSG
ncbi:MAG: hypothetical protein ACLVJH_10985 [Faecalibacterium prausnitzii]